MKGKAPHIPPLAVRCCAAGYLRKTVCAHFGVPAWALAEAVYRHNRTAAVPITRGLTRPTLPIADFCAAETQSQAA